MQPPCRRRRWRAPAAADLCLLGNHPHKSGLPRWVAFSSDTRPARSPHLQPPRPMGATVLDWQPSAGTIRSSQRSSGILSSNLLTPSQIALIGIDLRSRGTSGSGSARCQRSYAPMAAQGLTKLAGSGGCSAILPPRCFVTSHSPPNGNFWEDLAWNILSKLLIDFVGRGSWIRTNDLQYPKLPRYQAALYPDHLGNVVDTRLKGRQQASYRPLKSG
jgi:hypothetical protein